MDYRIPINAKNDVQHHGPCPLKSHQGPRRSTSFSLNLDKGIFRCFGCGAHGNLIDLACGLEGLDPAKPEDVHRAALILADRYKIASEKPAPKPKAAKPAASPPSGRAIVNAPLDFTLKGLEPDHAYLRDRGLSRETIDHFELGYASRGIMQGRIAIPLRNAEGKLIGYAGRIVDDSLITEENPKYRFPTSRVHDGKTYEFNKSHFLYHGHAIPTDTEDLIIVSNFPSVWWLWQHGFHHAVAVMGSSFSPHQQGLVITMIGRRGKVWVFTDGTKVGRYCAEEVLRLVTPYRFCRWIELRDNRKPTDCKPDELKELLA